MMFKTNHYYLFVSHSDSSVLCDGAEPFRQPSLTFRSKYFPKQAPSQEMPENNKRKKCKIRSANLRVRGVMSETYKCNKNSYKENQPNHDCIVPKTTTKP